MRSLLLLSQLPSQWVRLYSLRLRMFENLNWAGTHIKWWQHFVAQASVKDPGTWQAHLESEQGPFPWIIQTYANSTGHCGGCCCLLVVMHDDYGGLWGVSWAVVFGAVACKFVASYGRCKKPNVGALAIQRQAVCMNPKNLPFRIVFAVFDGFYLQYRLRTVCQNKRITDSPCPFIQLNDEQ